MADNVDYLGYAQAMNQLNPYAALGQQIGGTLSDIAARQRTEREAAPARELADIHLQTARRGLEEDIAKRAATQQVMGGADLTSTYAAQMRKAQRAEQTKSFTEGFDKLVASKSSPEALKRYTQAALSKDPDLATWAPYISYVDEGSIKITKPFGPNEAPDPTRPGSFLPPGVYTVTGSRTNDPTNPFAFQLIEPAKPEKADYKTREYISGNKTIFEESQDGGRTWKKVSEGPRYKPTAGGGTGMPKAPSGYRYTAAGDLEPIPGGPAAVKAGVAARGEEGKMASLDITIRSIQDLLSHPGRKAATGTSGGLNKLAIPGTARKGFLAKLDTLKAQTFIPQVAALKGMGALSDAEGKKLTDAVGALDPQMPEDEFVDSLNQIQSDLIAAKARISPESTETPIAPAVGRGGTAPTKRPPLSSFRKR